MELHSVNVVATYSICQRDETRGKVSIHETGLEVHVL